MAAARRSTPRILTLLLLVLLAAAVLASLGIGARALTPGTVWDALTSAASGRQPSSDEAVVALSRLPRTAAAILAGAALALAGTGMQGLTRNPLADPGILGVTSGASLAVVLGLFTLGISGMLPTMLFALLGAALTSVVVFLIAEFGPRGSAPVNLAIAGAAVAAGCQAVIGAILLGSQQTLETFRVWQIGSVALSSPEPIIAILPMILLGAILLLPQAGSLNSLALGDDVARGLGVSLVRSRWLVGAGFVLLAAGATALCGPIAFVGLAVPHILRMLSSPDHRRLMPLSMLGGAVLVLIADIVGRVVAPPSEVAAGVMTAILGAPVLLWLARSAKVSLS